MAENILKANPNHGGTQYICVFIFFRNIGMQGSNSALHGQQGWCIQICKRRFKKGHCQLHPLVLPLSIANQGPRLCKCPQMLYSSITFGTSKQYHCCFQIAFRNCTLANSSTWLQGLVGYTHQIVEYEEWCKAILARFVIGAIFEQEFWCGTQGIGPLFGFDWQRGIFDYNLQLFF